MWFSKWTINAKGLLSNPEKWGLLIIWENAYELWIILSHSFIVMLSMVGYRKSNFWMSIHLIFSCQTMALDEFFKSQLIWNSQLFKLLISFAYHRLLSVHKKTFKISKMISQFFLNYYLFSLRLFHCVWFHPSLLSGGLLESWHTAVVLLPFNRRKQRYSGELSIHFLQFNDLSFLKQIFVFNIQIIFD